MADHASADLADRERALVAYGIKLTRSPQAMVRDDVDGLRRAGFGDQAILEATHIIGYFNHINRLADGLGLELEDGWDEHPPWQHPAD